MSGIEYLMLMLIALYNPACCTNNEGKGKRCNH